METSSRIPRTFGNQYRWGVLVIIASDEIDPRVAKLSRGLLSDNLVNQWDHLGAWVPFPQVS